VKDLCKKHNVLFILDEVQTGFGRTGKLMDYMWDDAKPDILAVAKALSGGMMPVSATFTSDEIMQHIKPGDHGSTYGGNPLGMLVARVAIETLMNENMIENSLKMGDIFQDKVSHFKSSLVKEVRGRGLFRCVEIVKNKYVDANDLAVELMKQGLLTKATHDYMIRLAPALTINEMEINRSAKMIRKALSSLYQEKKGRKELYWSTKRGEKKEEEEEGEKEEKKEKKGKKEGAAQETVIEEAAKEEKKGGKKGGKKGSEETPTPVITGEEGKAGKGKKAKAASL
jgi:hypothetical protein